MKTKKRSLKGIMLIYLAFAFILASLPVTGFAQNQPTAFAILDFMKVKPENDAKYLDMEKNVWGPLHQERADKETIAGWALYRVLYTGTEDPYNYVTITLFNTTAHLEDPWVGIDPATILTGRDFQKDEEETGKSRELVKSQLISKVDEVLPEELILDDKYLIINYMKVKPENETAYLNVEKSIWRPVHQQFIKDGSRVGWSLWNTVFPTGSTMDYQYLTANYVLDFSKINMANYDAAFRKAHEGQDRNALDKKTMESRDIVRTELWQLVDMILKE